MKIIILFILLFSVQIAHGQKEPAAKPNFKDDGPFFWMIPDSTIDSKLCVKLAPLSLLGIYNGLSVRSGLEYRVSESFAVYNELGCYFLYGKGITAKVEFKNYIHTEKTAGNYYSFELYYKYQDYTALDSIQLQNFTKPYSKYYDVFKNVACLTFKLGKMTVYKFGFVADAFVGLGIRFRQATNTLTHDENNSIKDSSDYGPNVIANQAGFFVYPNFDLGVKIGYRIR